MLFKVQPDGQEPHLRPMTVTFFSEVALFYQKLETCGTDNNVAPRLTVMYRPPEKEKYTDISMPLAPPISDLEAVNVELHQSPTKAYNMGEPYNSWFSSCFGWEVMLVYLGPHLRSVLGNLSLNAASNKSPASKSWLSNISQALPSLSSTKTKDEDKITFADVAPYLVVTEESLQDVSARLPDGINMDITKFRPNIVLSGAKNAYEEDFWGGLTISNLIAEGERQSFDLILTQNCARCVSINIDYATGKYGTGQDGSALKMLSKDRRVDKGTKYSPIFGRYAFLRADESSKRTIRIGDEVEISKVNTERTKFGRLQNAPSQ